VVTSIIKARGLSYLYMLGMPFFGTDLSWIYNFQTVMLGLTLLIFFLGILAWFKNGTLALLTTALLAGCPVLLFYSRSSSVEGFQVFMSAVSLLCLKWACDRNTLRHWLFLALCLAFFAQARPETVFGLFAFIGVAFWKSQNQDLQDLRIQDRIGTTRRNPFVAFLATVSVFCLPVFCTLSYNRDSDLQGGAYGAHGHLFGNLWTDFKIMALPHTAPDGLMQYPFLPYFTWLAVAGFVVLVGLAVRRVWARRNGQTHGSAPTTGPSVGGILGFLMLYHIQSLILFDGVSADMTMKVQMRFILVVLPTMAFLGGYFLTVFGKKLGEIKYFQRVRAGIPLTGIVVLVWAQVLLCKPEFEANKGFEDNWLCNETVLLRDWLAEHGGKNPLVFYNPSSVMFSMGVSAYGYNALIYLDSASLAEIIAQSGGDVFVAQGLSTTELVGAPKMSYPSSKTVWEQLGDYFTKEQMLDTNLAGSDFSIYRLTGTTDRDPRALFRIVQLREADSLLMVQFAMPQSEKMPWRVEHLVNDSLILNSPYVRAYNSVGSYPFRLFTPDTNRVEYRIIDTVADTVVHTDYLRLLRKKSGG
jgi:hypothetical protein